MLVLNRYLDQYVLSKEEHISLSSAPSTCKHSTINLGDNLKSQYLCCVDVQTSPWFEIYSQKRKITDSARNI